MNPEFAELYTIAFIVVLLLYIVIGAIVDKVIQKVDRYRRGNR